jgi:hypothetical protein
MSRPDTYAHKTIAVHIPEAEFSDINVLDDFRQNHIKSIQHALDDEMKAFLTKHNLYTKGDSIENTKEKLKDQGIEIHSEIHSRGDGSKVHEYKLMRLIDWHGVRVVSKVGILPT